MSAVPPRRPSARPNRRTGAASRPFAAAERPAAGTVTPAFTSRYTKPDTISRRVEAHWVVCVEAAGHGLTQAEALATFQPGSEGPSSAQFTSGTFVLLKRGVLVPVGWQVSWRRFAHRDSDVARAWVASGTAGALSGAGSTGLVSPADMVALRLVAAVRTASAAHGGAARTRDVLRTYRAAGGTESTSQLMHLLRRLTAPSALPLTSQDVRADSGAEVPNDGGPAPALITGYGASGGVLANHTAPGPNGRRVHWWSVGTAPATAAPPSAASNGMTQAGARRVVAEQVPSDVQRPGVWPAADPAADTAFSPSSWRDAVIRAVETARTALGRLPDRVDLELWAAAHAGSDPVAAFLAGRRLGVRLSNAIDARLASNGALEGAPVLLLTRAAGRTHRPGGPPAFVGVYSTLTCQGGGPVRFGRLPISDGERERAVLDDACTALRVGLETAGARALDARAEREQTPVLVGLARARQGILATRLRAVLGPTTSDLAADAARHVTETLAAWYAAGPRRPYDAARHMTARLAARRADVAALGTASAPVADEPSGGGGRAAAPGTLATVGDPATLFPPEALDRLFPPGPGRFRRWQAKAWRLAPHVQDGIRRFPVAPASDAWAMAGAAGPVPHVRGPRRWLAGGSRLVPSGCDRADALTRAAELLGGPVARMLVRGATRVLGHVLRDPAPLVAALDALPPHAEHARRDLVVALGLLGVAPPTSCALLRSGDPHDFRAHLLAVVLADQAAAPSRVRRLAVTARGAPCVAIAQHAVLRADAGELLAVVG